MKMRKELWITAVFMLTAFGCAAEDSGGDKKPAKKEKTFIDAKHGYSLSFPADWGLSDKSSGSHMIRADITAPGGKAGLQVRFMDMAGLKGKFKDYVDWYIKQFIDDMQGHWGGDFEEKSRVFRKFGGLAGCAVVIHAKRRDGNEWLFKQYLVPWGREGGIVILQSGAEWDDREKYEPAFNAIADSISKTAKKK